MSAQLLLPAVHAVGAALVQWRQKATEHRGSFVKPACSGEV